MYYYNYCLQQLFKIDSFNHFHNELDNPEIHPMQQTVFQQTVSIQLQFVTLLRISQVLWVITCTRTMWVYHQHHSISKICIINLWYCSLIHMIEWKIMAHLPTLPSESWTKHIFITGNKCNPHRTVSFSYIFCSMPIKCWVDRQCMGWNILPHMVSVCVLSKGVLVLQHLS